MQLWRVEVKIDLLVMTKEKDPNTKTLLQTVRSMQGVAGAHLEVTRREHITDMQPFIYSQQKGGV